MKIFVFQVYGSETSQPFSEVVSAASRDPVSERLRDIGPEVKLEHIQFIQDQNIFLLDFSRLRFAGGPGRASRRAPIESFDFEDDEAFGEETAALFDVATENIFIQYNHNGIKSSHIANYFSIYRGLEGIGSDYAFEPRLDPDMEAKLRRKSQFRKLDISFSPGRLTTRDRAEGSGLGTALRQIGRSGAQRISLTISMERQPGHLVTDIVTPTIDYFRRNLVADEMAVSTLRVWGREDDDDPPEMLDLITHRLSRTYEVDPGPDLRYPRDERYRALQRARTELGPSLRRRQNESNH